MDWAGDFTKSCGRKKKENKERKQIFYKENGYLSPAGRSSSHSRTACSPTWIEKFYILYGGQIKYILQPIWGTNTVYFTLYFGDKYNIITLYIYGGQMQYILRSIWGTNTTYFTLSLGDRCYIFYALFGGQMQYILPSIWWTNTIYFTLCLMYTRFLRHQASIITVL